MRMMIRRAFMQLVGALALATLVDLSCAVAQDADEAAPKQVALTQALIDGLIAAQVDVRALESAAGQNKPDQEKPDTATEAKLAATAKAHGFDGIEQFGNVSYSVGLVMAGMDPATKTFVGSAAMIQKQIAQVQADTSMQSKDKKEALDELAAASQQRSAEPPSPANIALVKTNFDRLSQAVQPAD